MSLSKGRGSKINKMLWTLFINDPKCGCGERTPPFVIHMCVASLVAGHKWGPSVRGVTFAPWISSQPAPTHAKPKMAARRRNFD